MKSLDMDIKIIIWMKYRSKYFIYTASSLFSGISCNNPIAFSKVDIGVPPLFDFIILILVNYMSLNFLFFFHLIGCGFIRGHSTIDTPSSY